MALVGLQKLDRTQTLSGTNTYSVTTINAGTLTVSEHYQIAQP